MTKLKKKYFAYLLVGLLSFWYPSKIIAFSSSQASSLATSKDRCRLQKILIHVQPFVINKKDAPLHSPALVLQTLLKDYLNLIPDVSATFKPSSSALILRASLIPQKEGSVLFKSTVSKGENSIFNYEAPLKFPENLNPLLIDYILKVAVSLGEKIKEKQILPFLNQTSSVESYLFYADGVQAYHKHDLISAKKAFENAIQNDYNYIPAYVFLSQVLRDILAPRAEVEWQKAQLLNPDLSKKIRETYLCP